MENQLKANSCTQKDYTNVYPMVTLLQMKDAGLRIRLQRELRESFLKACLAEDKPAAQVLREFMREYVSKNNKTSEADNSGNDKSSE